MPVGLSTTARLYLAHRGAAFAQSLERSRAVMSLKSGEREGECLTESLSAASVWSCSGSRPVGGSVYAHDRELRNSYHRDNPGQYRDNVEH
jgi:hypothetical protein